MTDSRSENSYYKQIDGLRFISVFGVMVAHWYQNSFHREYLKELPFGTGVVFFFVISGFLITQILLRFRLRNETEGNSQGKSILSFYMRRTLRIFPIYYLTIFVLYAIDFDQSHALLPWLLTYTLNIQMAITNNLPGAFTHLWSLAVEEQFYLFWTFIIVFAPKKFLKHLIILFILISLALKYYMFYKTSRWLGANTLVITNMHSLGLGGLLAYYEVFRREKFYTIGLGKMKAAMWLVLAVILFLFATFVPYDKLEFLKPYNDPLMTIVYGLAVFVAARNGFVGLGKYFLENKVVVYFGRISYGLYMYHLFMSPFYFNFVNHFLHWNITNDKIYFVIFFVLDVLLATLSWFIIEKPILGLKKHFTYFLKEKK